MMPDRDATMMQPSSTPGKASAEDGFVLLDGPDGVALSMTPDAAEETGRQLIAAATDARSQRLGGGA